MSNKTLIQTIRYLLAGRNTIPCKITNRLKYITDSDIMAFSSMNRSTHPYEALRHNENFQIYWKDVTIDSASMESIILAREIAKIEDFIIFRGDSKDGLLYSAGNLSAKPLDYLTVGNAAKSVDIGIELLCADGYDDRLGFSLLLNKKQYTELIHSYMEIPYLKSLLRGGGVYHTEIPCGTGLLLPSMTPNHNYFNINVDMDWKIVNLTKNTYRVAVSINSTVNNPHMICRIENI